MRSDKTTAVNIEEIQAVQLLIEKEKSTGRKTNSPESLIKKKQTFFIDKTLGYSPNHLS